MSCSSGEVAHEVRSEAVAVVRVDGWQRRSGAGEQAMNML